MLELEEEIDVYRCCEKRPSEAGQVGVCCRYSSQEGNRAPALWGSTGLSGNRHWAWPRWLQLVTAAPSYEKAAAVFLGDILKHLVFCQSFPARVGEGFRASRPWLCSSVCPWQERFPFCSAMEEPKAVPWK